MMQRSTFPHRALAVLCAIPVLAAVLFTAPAAAFAAAPSIAYDGASNELTLAGGEDGTTADLFADFKGLVPGDTRDQTVSIEFSHISAETRLYIQADTSRLSDKAKAVLDQMQLAVSFDGEGIVAEGQEGSPHNVFAAKDPVLVARVTGAATATMTLQLSIPTSVGNELAELQEAVIPWIITVEEEDGTGDSTSLLPRAMDLVAYEGGLGTGGVAGTGEVGDALPEPEWTNVDWESATITVDNQPWDEQNPYWGAGAGDLPFRWSYGTAMGDPALVATSARAGLYFLVAAPLEGNPVVTVNGKLLVLPEDYVITTQDGSDVIIEVREVTSNEAADALSSDYFKNVYGGESAGLSLRSVLAGAVPSAYADEPSTMSALDGSFTSTGTHDGDCDTATAHAHVKDGTTFVKNGHLDQPVGDGARIGLLWDEFIPGVLGDEGREGVLNAKARAAVGGSFASSDSVQTRFRYLDLVDMNDGNLWVSTADQSSVSVFVPYFEGMGADDQIAVVYFDGLTRDYTVDLPSADLDAEVARTQAHRLHVTKTADGILFEVPWCEFGPFELLWIDAGGGTGDPGDNTGTDDDFTDDKTDTDHAGALTQTGDSTLVFAGAIALAAVLALILGLMLKRRRNG